MTKRSQSTRKPGPDILVPTATRTITIGVTGTSKRHDFDVAFDDVFKLRAFMAVKRDILEDVEALPDDADSATQMEFIEKTSTRVAETVDLILGEGAFDLIFGGARPLFGGLTLLGEIERFVGPAYDAAFSKYAPTE